MVVLSRGGSSRLGDGGVGLALLDRDLCLQIVREEVSEEEKEVDSYSEKEEEEEN